MLDWASRDNQLLLNPRLPGDARAAFERAWGEALVTPELARQASEGLVGIATSGSSGERFGRLVVLSRSALLASAASVNSRLRSDSNDVWFKTLPDFHVGGLGILARAYLSGARVAQASDGGWSPTAFYEELGASRATLLSLVPTQLFDLVKAGFTAPSQLRAAIIGGGRLPEDLRLRARALGWPTFPSYGLTECCSQVATALSPDDARLVPLDHVQLRIAADDSTDGRIEIRSAALLVAEIVPGRALRDPKRDGWLTTSDRGRLESDGSLAVLGRDGDFVKIGGEGVLMSRLEERLEGLRLARASAGDAAILAARDERLGARVVLVTDLDDQESARLAESFNGGVAPFERIRSVHRLPTLPRSAIGKLLRARALELVGLELPTNL